MSFFLHPQVQLKDTIKNFPGKMNTELAESGLNLSVGQRQLVCLAGLFSEKSDIDYGQSHIKHVDQGMKLRPRKP